MSIWIIIVLMLLGAAAILLEVVVPSAGLLAIGGVGVIVFAVVQAYRVHDLVVGTAFLTAAIVFVPVLLFLALKMFPRSGVGKRLILSSSETQEEGFVSHVGPLYADLISKEGEALTDLRPSGMIRLEGKKYSVVTSGEYIRRGDGVRVLRTEGSRIVVARSGPREGQNDVETKS